MSSIIYKDESYAIVGCLFDVYNNLGSGFSEIVYKDALEYEFKKHHIPFKRVSNCKLAILANFHKDLLDQKRIVL